MGAALKLVSTDGSDGDDVRYARTIEERFAWLKLVRKENVPACGLKLAMLLFDKCNSITGQCNPSHETIRRECQMTNPSRAIRELREKGLIEVQQSPHKSNQYLLVLRDENNPEGSSELIAQGDETDHPGDQSGTSESSELSPKPCCNLESNPEKEPESEPRRSAEAAWLRHKPSEKDVEYALENGLDNRRVEIEWPEFIRWQIDNDMAYQQQRRKWRRWVARLLTYEHEKATGETPKTREDKRRQNTKRVLDKPGKARSPLTMLPAGPPSDFTKSMRKQIVGDEGQPEAVQP